MDAIKTIADSIRAERKAAAEEAAGSGTASAEDIKNAVAAGQDRPAEEKPAEEKPAEEQKPAEDPKPAETVKESEK